MKGINNFPQKFSEKIINLNGVSRLKVYEENKNELKKYFTRQQKIIDTSQNMLKTFQIPSEYLTTENEPEKELLKIDCFFNEFRNRRSKFLTRKTNSVRNSIVIPIPKKIQEIENKQHFSTRINIKNYNKHFEFNSNYSDYCNNLSNSLNTCYNVSFKRSFPFGEDDAVTLANLVKKLDIKNKIKLDKEKLRRVSKRAIETASTLYNNYSTEDSSPKATISSTSKSRALKTLTSFRFDDIDKEAVKVNRYSRYQSKTIKNLDNVNKFNDLFENVCREEKSAEKLLLAYSNKLMKKDGLNFEEKIHGFKPLSERNPVKLAKLNIKRLYNK
jgi:hypothetical protein